MHITFLCEGKTESKTLHDFFKRWLDPKTEQPIGLRFADIKGWRGFLKDAAQKARFHLDNPKTIAVFGLIDLYGPEFYPKGCSGTSPRCSWAKDYLESLVGQERYHQFFAVQEVEAWLLSDPAIFPFKVTQRQLSGGKCPEDVNNTAPPAMKLKQLYKSAGYRTYRKVVDGSALFQALDSNIAYEKCPNLRSMLDRMLSLARQYQSGG